MPLPPVAAEVRDTQREVVSHSENGKAGPRLSRLFVCGSPTYKGKEVSGTSLENIVLVWFCQVITSLDIFWKRVSRLRDYFHQIGL